MRVYIETQRLIIRDPIAEDFDVIWTLINDVEVTQFIGGVTKRTKEEAYKKHLARCNVHDDKPREYSVILKETNAYIGYCGFQYCEDLEGIELLYGLVKDYWGKGYAFEAAQSVLNFGQEVLKLNEIVAGVNYENTASDKILVKLGMDYIGDVDVPSEGLLKKYRLRNTLLQDTGRLFD
jgi:RimJ/RimL family protein N-acetyltransferase